MFKCSFKTISRWLLAWAIVLLPFNDFRYLENVLGEMSREGAFYPILIAMIVWSLGLMKGMRLKVPKHQSAKVLVLFLLWIVISALANSVWIVSLQTKGRTGVEKLVLQLVLIVFVALSALLVFTIIRRTRQPLYVFRRYIMISFLVVGLYSLVEIIFLSGSDWASATLQTIDSLIYNTGESSRSSSGRLHSVSGEPSWFAMYCSFIFPWVLSYVFTKQRHIWIYVTLSAYFIVLVVLTQSRTAYFTLALQLSLFLLGLFSFKRDATKLRLFFFKSSRLVFFAIVTLVAVVCMGAFFSKLVLANSSVLDVFSSLISNDETYNLSNLTRFGSQVTGFNMALDHPIFGVGLGQYGFYMPAYVPSWAKVSPEIQKMISPIEGTTWPPVYSIYARIAAELGWIGLGIWLSLWTIILAACFKRYQLNNRINNQRDILGLALMVSIIGVMLSGFTTDSLRFFGFWINMGLAWSYLSQSKTTPSNSSLLGQFASVSNPNAE